MRIKLLTARNTRFSAKAAGAFDGRIRRMPNLKFASFNRQQDCSMAEMEGCLLRKARPYIFEHLQAESGDALALLRRLGSGLSGAEVYLARLNTPNFSGDYFLKIDLNVDGSLPAPVDIPFPCSYPLAPFGPLKAGNYLIQLSRPAGGSCINYKSLRDEIPTLALLTGMLASHLAYCQRDYIPPASTAISPVSICHRLLKPRLEKTGSLYRFLAAHLAIRPDLARSISFNGGILPNPFAFALTPELWNDFRMPDFRCVCHGDMHGNNFLYSGGGDYCLIDIDNRHFRQDACLFYDSAYLEIAELLNAHADESVAKWQNALCLASGENFDAAGLSGLQLAQAIMKAEAEWIKNQCGERCSYEDALQQCRLLARVITGLNFTAKRAVDDQQRLRAFLYAAAFLKKLLETAGIQYWKAESVLWDNEKGEKKKAQLQALTTMAASFSPDNAYILICGEGGSAASAECLARIPWHSVFCFAHDSDSNRLYGALQRSRGITPIYSGAQEGDVATPIWIFAAGHAGHPESVSQDFASWNRNGHAFFERQLFHCLEATAWRDPVVIIDAKSLDKRYVREAVALCHRLGFEELAIIGGENSWDRAEDWEPMKIVWHDLDLEDLADWARLHLPPATSAPALIPRSSGAVCLPEDDAIAISAYADLIHDGMGAEAEADAEGFYYGAPVSWEALRRSLCAPREEAIRSLIAKLERKQDSAVIVRYTHLPGAGASTICKSAAWRLRAKRPVLELRRTGSGLEDALLRITHITDLPLLLLADNDFSANEINELRETLAARRIACAILFPQRNMCTDGAALDCGVLDDSEAITFQMYYSSKLERESYAALEKKNRKDALERLATYKDHESFRMPFFFGMFAFEKDFISIDDYIIRITTNVKQNEKVERLLQFTAVLTLQMETGGLNFRIGARLGGLSGRPGARKTLSFLSEACGAPILCYQGQEKELRIIHPILAEKILAQYPRINATADFYIGILEEIAEYSSQLPADDFSRLAKKLFLAREELDTGEKAKFSPLVEKLADYGEKRRLFEALIESFPNDAHFYQHFGRLVSLYDPDDGAQRALALFDKAIELDSASMTHWHARGHFRLMRMKRNIGTCENLAEIYNRCCGLADRAAADLEEAFCRADDRQKEYPANSLIELAVSIQKAASRIAGQDSLANCLTTPITPEAKWLVRIADRAEQLANEFKNSEKGKSDFTIRVLSELEAVSLSAAELESRIGSNDHFLKLIWLNRVDPSDISPAALEKTAQWARELMLHGKAMPGLICQWFLAELTLGKTGIAELRDALRAAQKPETELICSYFLTCLAVAGVLGGDSSKTEESVRGLKRTRSLWLEQGRPGAARLYYDPSKKSGLSRSPERSPEIKCKVKEEVRSLQDGKLYVESHPWLEAHFVPKQFDCKVNQSMEKHVTCRIAFGYDGLRGEALNNGPTTQGN